MSKKLLYNSFMILAVLGVIVSGFLLYEHYSETGTEFCKFGKNFDCNIVNKSPYANLDGIFYMLVIDFKVNMPIPNIPIPVAGMGLLMILLLMWAMYNVYYNKISLKVSPEKYLKVIRYSLLTSLLFAAYLVFVEVRLLKRYCIFCIALDVILVLLTIIAFKVKTNSVDSTRGVEHETN